MWKTQQRIAEFDATRFQSLGPGYLGLSLAGEAGELANLLKKIWRLDPAIGRPEGFAVVSAEHRERIADELADIVMLSVVLANHLEIDVEAELERKLGVIEERLATGYYGHDAASG